MKRYIGLLFILISNSSYAQFTYSLTGNPVNTAGWVWSNNTYIANDTIVLNNPQGNLAAYIYYDQPIDLTSCSQFTVDFDYAITDPVTPTRHADGIAFWYITTPPGGFVLGGGIGVPTPATGTVLYLDTWDNDGNGDNPRVAVRSLQNNNYVEGSNANAIGTDVTNQAYITDGTWHHCTFAYNNGVITVSMDGAPPIITGNTPINMVGYFGLSSSTGASWSKHMLRNVVINGTSVAAPVGRDTGYCLGAVANPLDAAGVNLKWYDTPSGGNPLPSAPIPGTGVPGVYQWYVSQTIEGCGESLRDTVTVIVNVPPAPPGVTDVTYCIDAPALPLTANGQNLLWYDDRAGAGSATPITPSTLQPGHYRLLRKPDRRRLSE